MRSGVLTTLVPTPSLCSPLKRGCGLDCLAENSVYVVTVAWTRASFAPLHQFTIAAHGGVRSQVTVANELKIGAYMFGLDLVLVHGQMAVIGGFAFKSLIPSSLLKALSFIGDIVR